jgi:thiol-disulfide isomerase/thioredoxin
MTGGFGVGWGLLVIMAALLLLAPAAVAGEGPYKVGESLPTVTLQRPSLSADAAYLGVAAGKGSFGLARIKRPYLLVEIFSMYCPICQAEAPKVNQLYKKLQASPAKDKVALVGIGVGNSDYEVGYFKKKFSVPFPLFSDGDYAQHKLFREPRTPYFLLLKLQGEKKPKVLISHLGPMGKPEDFLKRIESKIAAD